MFSFVIPWNTWVPCHLSSGVYNSLVELLQYGGFPKSSTSDLQHGYASTHSVTYLHSMEQWSYKDGEVPSIITKCGVSPRFWGKSLEQLHRILQNLWNHGVHQSSQKDVGPCFCLFSHLEHVKKTIFAPFSQHHQGPIRCRSSRAVSHVFCCMYQRVSGSSRNWCVFHLARKCSCGFPPCIQWA